MLACHIHDYVEVACLYGINVELTLKTGETIVGKASTTRINDARQECITLVTVKDKEPVDVVLDTVTSMRAVESNPHFDVVQFGTTGC